MQMQRKKNGYTLIELMIVVAVIGSLSALAVYNYNRYGFRGRRAEGRELAMRIAAAEERYFTNFNAYTDDFTKLKLTGGDKSDNGFYLATINVPTGNLTFTVTATPQAGQAKDKCLNLTVNNTGFKGYSGDVSNGACW